MLGYRVYTLEKFYRQGEEPNDADATLTLYKSYKCMGYIYIYRHEPISKTKLARKRQCGIHKNVQNNKQTSLDE